MAVSRDLHLPQAPDIFDAIRTNRRVVVSGALGFVLLIVAAILAATFAADGAAPGRTLAGMEVDPPRTLPALDLQRPSGEAWSSAETGDRFALVFFGYTHCPDICPLTLSRATQTIDRLGADAAKVDFYFVTVDPERDTPDRLGKYVSQFDPAITGLTGTPEQLDATMAAFGVVAQQVPYDDDGSYAVDHTATSFLVVDGEIRVLYAHDTPAGDIVADLDTLLAETAGD